MPYGVARNAYTLEQGPHGELRMDRGWRDFLALAAGDGAPRNLVEIGIEPGQHDSAVRQLRDRGEQFCGCRHRTC